MLFNSVCNHTRNKQIGLPLRGRPILLSLVWTPLSPITITNTRAIVEHESAISLITDHCWCSGLSCVSLGIFHSVSILRQHLLSHPPSFFGKYEKQHVVNNYFNGFAAGYVFWYFVCATTAKANKFFYEKLSMPGTACSNVTRQKQLIKIWKTHMGLYCCFWL